MIACEFCKKDRGVALYCIGNRWVCERCVPNLTVSQLARDRVEDLIKLCHPDRHRGPMEPLATKTTQWLLGLRKKAAKARA
jgi:hypothetical protein